MATRPEWLLAYIQLKQRYEGQAMAAYREANGRFIEACLSAGPDWTVTRSRAPEEQALNHLTEQVGP